jgi:hypothetical protein
MGKKKRPPRRMGGGLLFMTFRRCKAEGGCSACIISKVCSEMTLII